MCGIVGFSGKRGAKDVIYSGLKQLEYRGYDSAGVLVVDGKKTALDKAVGVVGNVDLSDLPKDSGLGIGHTRWATHGGVSEINAHPHTYGTVSIVHNGIIENHKDLAKQYKISPVSETDSEVLAGLVNHFIEADGLSLRKAMAKALSECQGTYGVLAVSPETDGQTLVAARLGSPIVIGVGKDGEYTVASDPSAILSTDKMVFLGDGEIAEIKDDSLKVYDFDSRLQSTKEEVIETQTADDDLGDFASYLQKEIFDQPRSLGETMRGRISGEGKVTLGGPNLSDEQIKQLKSLYIIGCGTAYYAGLTAKYPLEELLGIPVVIEHASEFRYRHAALEPESVALFMSQSGETADTLAARAEAERRGIPTMGVVNTVGSTLARSVSHGGIYLHAGVEKSVASTKAYSSMVVALLMLGSFWGERRGLPLTATRALGRDLRDLPQEIQTALESFDAVQDVAAQVASFSNCFVLGRDNLYPVALEGALKIAEVSYIHAQAFPTGEMKHGPIALIDDQHLSIVLMPEDKLMYEKTCSGIQEIKAREGKVLTIGSLPPDGLYDWHIPAPTVGDNTSGLVINCLLQQLAHGMAKSLGRNIDRPRNLAKSVTVE